jgi:hypothetical protein
MTDQSTLPCHGSLLEEAPEHLKLIGLVAVNRSHLGRTCCRLMSILSNIGLPAAQALWPALTSKALQIQMLSKRTFISQEQMKQLESCLVALKRCVDVQEAVENICYGIGRHGLVLWPTSDECGRIVPVSKKRLQQLADDIADCTTELGSVCRDGAPGRSAAIQSDRGGQCPSPLMVLTPEHWD